MALTEFRGALKYDTSSYFGCICVRTVDRTTMAMQRLTRSTRHDLERASSTIAFHVSSLRSSVGLFPTMNNDERDRVIATFIRRTSISPLISARFHLFLSWSTYPTKSPQNSGMDLLEHKTG